ncbi:MAG: hypothetical protein VYC17_05025 [Nitrospinota bacterium]|nr:hypothetical protein [Nitrospinota bacterium]
MEVNNLGNTNPSSRPNNEAANPNSPPERTTASIASLRDVAESSQSTLVTPPSPAEEAIQESNTVQSNEGEIIQTAEQGTEYQADLSIQF